MITDEILLIREFQAERMFTKNKGKVEQPAATMLSYACVKNKMKTDYSPNRSYYTITVYLGHHTQGVEFLSYLCKGVNFHYTQQQI